MESLRPWAHLHRPNWLAWPPGALKLLQVYTKQGPSTERQLLIPFPPAPSKAFAMVLCLLALLLPGLLVPASKAQPVLSQPASILALPGQTVKLSCALNPGYNIREYGVAWYQQRPGSSPRYLLYYNSEVDKHKPSGIPDRFSASKDPSSNACILTIAAVRAEDHADYYCSVRYPIYYL